MTTATIGLGYFPKTRELLAEWANGQIGRGQAADAIRRGGDAVGELAVAEAVFVKASQIVEGMPAGRHRDALRDLLDQIPL